MSNDCHWVESRLEDFLSDSTDPEVRTRIESHLKTCDTCRQNVEGYGEVDKRLRAYLEHQLVRAESGARLSLRPMRLADGGLLWTRPAVRQFEPLLPSIL